MSSDEDTFNLMSSSCASSHSDGDLDEHICLVNQQNNPGMQ